MRSVSLRISDDIVELIRGLHPVLKRVVRAAFEEICRNPECGKALREELQGLMSYRAKRFRIIYRRKSSRQIDIIALGPRRNIYKETYKLIKKSKP